MSSGGGKGGKNESKTEQDLPEWLKQPAIRNLQRAEDVQRIEYMPYRGAEIAAFNDVQNAAMNNNIATAKAFGLLDPNSTMTAEGQMPTPTTFDGGFKGYSSMPLYDQALAETKAQQPGAIAQYEALFGAPAMAQLNAARNSGGGRFRGNASSPSHNPSKPYDPTSEPYYTPMGGPRRSVEGGGGAARERQRERLAKAEAERVAAMDKAMSSYETRGTPRYVSQGNPHSSGGLTSRLDSKGATPTPVSRPIDEIVAGYRSKK